MKSVLRVSIKDYHSNMLLKGRILTLPPERRSPTRQVLKNTKERAESEFGAPPRQQIRGQCQDAPKLPVLRGGN